MKHPDRAMVDAATKAGWTTATQLTVALEYIINQRDNQAFEDFLNAKVKEEAEMSGDTPNCPFCNSSNTESLKTDHQDWECYDCGEEFTKEEVDEVQRRDEKHGKYPGKEDVAN